MGVSEEIATSSRCMKIGVFNLFWDTMCEHLIKIEWPKTRGFSKNLGTNQIKGVLLLSERFFHNQIIEEQSMM